MRRAFNQALVIVAGSGALALCLYLFPTPVASEPPVLAETAPMAQAEKTLPSQAVVRAVEKATRGTLPEPYFASRGAAAAFLEQWQGRLPAGKPLLAQADDFDAGAENGHLAPVELWINGESRVMGLTGEAVFEPAPGGLKIAALRLSPIPLAVDSWSAARERVRQALPSAGEPQQTEAPFYGQFRFRAGGSRCAVDARTGAVAVE